MKRLLARLRRGRVLTEPAIRLPTVTSPSTFRTHVAQAAGRELQDARRIIASQRSRIGMLEAEVSALRRGRR